MVTKKEYQFNCNDGFENCSCAKEGYEQGQIIMAKKCLEIIKLIPNPNMKDPIVRFSLILKEEIEKEIEKLVHN